MDKTPNKHLALSICFILALCIFAVYWQVHSYDFVSYDDNKYGTENPNANAVARPRMVAVFETEGGWNQFGGPELLAPENHGGEGCNILFSDLHVEFV